MNSKIELNMTDGALLPKLLRFIIPLALSSLLQIAFNAADLIVVGRFGRDVAMAAVGSNGALINLVINVLAGLGVGGGILCSRYFGAKEEQKLRSTVTTTLLTGFFGGILFGLLGFFFSAPLLRLIGAPEEIAPLAGVYLKIYFAGMPVIALYNFAGSALRAIGDTRHPLIYLAIAGVLNVFLNLFFVLVVGIDVAGVALATVLSQCVSCYLTTRCLMRYHGLKLRDLRFSRNIFQKVVRIGLPAGIQGSLFSISNFIIQSAINSFGAAVIAGNAACVSVEGLLMCSQDAVTQAASTAVSQNVGAQKYHRSCRCVTVCLALTCGITAVSVALVLLIRRPLLGLYTPDPAAIEAGLIRMSIIVVMFILNGTMNALSGIIRGYGRSLLPAFVTFAGVCVFRVIWIYTVFARVGTLRCLFLSYPITWIITTVAHMICYYLVRKKPFSEAALQSAE